MPPAFIQYNVLYHLKLLLTVRVIWVSSQNARKVDALPIPMAALAMTAIIYKIASAKNIVAGRNAILLTPLRIV